LEALMSSVHHAEQRSAPDSPTRSIHELRAALRGRVIAPGDPDYESTRLVVNAAIDHRPALIIRPADSADVSLVVSAARAHGIELAIRGS
jgi:FAD/FMN-containing dehydrogenase